MKHKSNVRILLSLAFIGFITACYGQTKIKLPTNDFPIEKDIELDKELKEYYESRTIPVKDLEISAYIQSIGKRLISVIPIEYQNSNFQFAFTVLNEQGINAFALPRGTMFVLSGLIGKCENEGELASVMAHEVSHVLLRHGTAKYTVNNATKQIDDVFADESICAVLGNLCGVLKRTQSLSNATTLQEHSREFETQADILGLQILKRAGYNPQDMVNMFLVLKKYEGSGTLVPWKRSHPDTDIRIQRIEQEIKLIGGNNTASPTSKLLSTQAKLAKITSPQNHSQTAQVSEQATVGYNIRVTQPSKIFKTYSTEVIEISVPDNWYSRVEKDAIFFAPNGAFGSQGITHGIMFGIQKEATNNLKQTVDSFLTGMLRANPYLTLANQSKVVTLNGREFGQVFMSGISPITKKMESVTMYITPLTNNIVLHVSTVSPQAGFENYQPIFDKVIHSLTIKTN